MKRVKNYIETELAKKKIARYKYWSIKDENGITIVSSEDNAEGRSFGEMLDKIIADNVDAEVQVKYGTNEQSSRQNPPFFIKVNEEIEWIEPEEDEEVKINGVPHKVDKNGNVNINLTTPKMERPEIETAVPIDMMRSEMESQLQGIRKEYELKEEKWQMDMHNRLMEQDLKFREMLLAERENRVAEREQQLISQESQLQEKKEEITEDVKGYVKHIPAALGGFIKDWIKEGAKSKSGSLSGSKKRKPTKKRNTPQYSIVEQEEIEEDEEPDNQIEMDFEEEEEELEAREQEKEDEADEGQEREEDKTETTNQNQKEDEKL
jgi:hypothetical protein